LLQRKIGPKKKGKKENRILETTDSALFPGHGAFLNRAQTKNPRPKGLVRARLRPSFPRQKGNLGKKPIEHMIPATLLPIIYLSGIGLGFILGKYFERLEWNKLIAQRRGVAPGKK
jgi:hypothetical protein